MRPASFARLLAGQGPASLGLALGLLLPPLKATMSGLAAVGGDLYLELALLGLVVGLLVRRRGGGRRVPLVTVGAPVAVWLAGMALLSGFGLIQGLRAVLGIVSSAAAFGLLFFIVRELAPLDKRVPGTSLPALPLVLLTVSLGLVLGGSLLPFIGPSLSLALVLGLLAWPVGVNAGGTRPALVLSFISLALLAAADLLPMRAYLAGAGGGSGPVLRHAWYADGPARAVDAGRRLVRTTLCGGSQGWQNMRSAASGREVRRGISLSTMMARELAPGGNLLLIGPAAGAAWQDLSRAPGGRVVLLDDRRTAWWFRHSLPAGRQSGFAAVVGRSRAFLDSRKGKFDLAHYIDTFQPEALAKGSIGGQPAYHLTVEAVRSYLDSLNDDGILVFEVPYSLRMVAILDEIGSRENFPVEGNLLVYHEPGNGRDVVIFRKTPLERDQVKRMNRMAARRRAVAYYQPGDQLMVNPIVRLIWARRPRGYYAAGKEEITPPTDDRPFFYQIQKFVPRTRPDERVGLTPLQNRRILGMIPPGDLPWVVLATAGVVGGAVLFFRRLARRRRRNGGANDWRYRFMAFFGLNGFTLGLFAAGGTMILRKELLPAHLAMCWAGPVVLAGLAAGLLAEGWPENRVHALPVWRMWLMLPAMMLPILCGLTATVPSLSPFGKLIWPGSLAPALVFGGAVLGDGLRANRQQGHAPLAQAVGLILLGGLVGAAAAIPVSQTFGFAFALVFAWLGFFISLRIFRRIPRDRGGNAEPSECPDQT